MITCPHCNGKREIEVTFGFEDCDVCYGTGAVDTDTATAYAACIREANEARTRYPIRILVLADGETWERLGAGDVYVVDLTEEEYTRIQDDEKPRNVVDLVVRGRKVT